MAAKPNGLLATSGLELLTWSTPNGYKVSIFLEELKEAYGIDYTYQAINLDERVQKQDWYKALHPAGMIPCLIDHDNGGLAMMEGQAILQYLCRTYDRDAKFHFRDDPERAECEQWMGFAQSQLGPMAGEANFFYRFSKTKDLFALNRAISKLEDYYNVLEKRLENRMYLVGDRFSIADLPSFTIIEVAAVGGIELSKYPNIKRWAANIERRPAVVEGQNVPQRIPIMGDAYYELLEKNQGFRTTEEGLKAVLAEAKERYGESQ